MLGHENFRFPISGQFQGAPEDSRVVQCDFLGHP